jgi:hypothetical protein
MRSSKRIYPFCNELASIWKDNFPDWRFAQFISNFMIWMANTKGIVDPFFIEDDKFIEWINEYVKEVKV